MTEAQSAENLHLEVKFNEKHPDFGLNIEHFDIFNEYNNVDFALVYCDRKKLESASIQARIIQDYVQVHETLTFVKDPLISDDIQDNFYERDVTHFARRKPHRHGEHAGKKETQETFVTAVKAKIIKPDNTIVKIKTQVMAKEEAKRKFKENVQYKEEEVLLLEEGEITRRESEQLIFSLGKIGKHDKIIVDFTYMTRAEPALYTNEPTGAGPNMNWNAGMNYDFSLDLMGHALSGTDLENIFGARCPSEDKQITPTRPNGFSELIKQRKLDIVFQVPQNIKVISVSDTMRALIKVVRSADAGYYSISPTDPEKLDFKLSYNCTNLKQYSKVVTNSLDNRITEEMMKVDAFETPDGTFETNIAFGIRRNIAESQFFDYQCDTENREYLILIDQCSPQLLSIKQAVKMMLQSLDIGSVFNLITVGKPNESVRFRKWSESLTETNFPDAIEFINDIPYIKPNHKDITTTIASVMVDTRNYQFSGEDSKRQTILISDGRQHNTQIMAYDIGKVLKCDQYVRKSSQSNKMMKAPIVHDPTNRFFFVGCGKSPNRQWIREYCGEACDQRGAFRMESDSESLSEAALAVLNISQMSSIPDSSWTQKSLQFYLINGKGKKEILKNISKFTYNSPGERRSQYEHDVNKMYNEYQIFNKSYTCSHLDSNCKIRGELTFLTGNKKKYTHVIEAPAVPLSCDTLQFKRQSIIKLRNKLNSSWSYGSFGRREKIENKENTKLAVKLGVLTPWTAFYGVKEGKKKERLAFTEMEIGFGNPRGKRRIYSNEELCSIQPNRYEYREIRHDYLAGHSDRGPDRIKSGVNDDDEPQKRSAFMTPEQSKADQVELEIVKNGHLRTEVPFEITDAGKINGMVPHSDEIEEILYTNFPLYRRAFFKVKLYLISYS